MTGMRQGKAFSTRAVEAICLDCMLGGCMPALEAELTALRAEVERRAGVQRDLTTALQNRFDEIVALQAKLAAIAADHARLVEEHDRLFAQIDKEESK